MRKATLTGFVSALVAVLALVPSEGAQAAHQSNPHWRRATGEATITLEFRNQAGSSYATYVNTGISRWGSKTTNWYPNGPARTDVSLRYYLGGAASCNDTSPTRVITMCIVANSSPHRLVDGTAISEAHMTSDASNHVLRAWIHINDAHKTNQGIWTHEMGHTLQNGHRAAGDPSVMRAVVHPSYPNPDQHDLDTSISWNSHTH